MNVKGTGGDDKRRAMKELVRKCKIDILYLQEMNCEGDGESIMRERGGARLTKGVASTVEGRAGGIMILGNQFEVEEVVED